MKKVSFLYLPYFLFAAKPHAKIRFEKENIAFVAPSSPISKEKLEEKEPLFPGMDYSVVSNEVFLYCNDRDVERSEHLRKAFVGKKSMFGAFKGAMARHGFLSILMS